MPTNGFYNPLAKWMKYENFKPAIYHIKGSSLYLMAQVMIIQLLLMWWCQCKVSLQSPPSLTHLRYHGVVYYATMAQVELPPHLEHPKDNTYIITSGNMMTLWCETIFHFAGPLGWIPMQNINGFSFVSFKKLLRKLSSCEWFGLLWCSCYITVMKLWVFFASIFGENFKTGLPLLAISLMLCLDNYHCIRTVLISSHLDSKWKCFCRWEPWVHMYWNEIVRVLRKLALKYYLAYCSVYIILM